MKIAVVILLLFARVSLAQLDDRAVTIRSEKEAENRRAQLVKHVWGDKGIPRDRLPQVITNVASPVKALTNLVRVDEFRIALATNLEGLAYHFVPRKKNGELVVVHHGHACTLDDDPGETDAGYGLQRTINALLREGYGVIGAFMPRMRPGDCTGGHDKIFQIPTEGNPMRFFLEPTAISLNHVRREYRAFHMTGLSGGGWTTTIYAALDPTIQISIPVAGSIPLYLRTGSSVGDQEQADPPFYKKAGYPDLYVLGGFGPKRKQIQILCRRDDCCFGELQHDPKVFPTPYVDSMRAYEREVANALKQIGRGSFRLEIDETAPSHMISHHTVRMILAELRMK